MSKWNPIVSGRRVWAALRDLSRRWCPSVGSGPSRRVTANGFSSGAYRARQIMPKRPADAARMGARLQLSSDCIGISTPKHCNLKIPLPIPRWRIFSAVSARKIPLPDDIQIEPVECVNYMIRMELSAMRAINFEPHRYAFGVFPLTAGESRTTILNGRRSGPTSISNSRSWCIGRSPRCGSVLLDRISGIARTRREATADRGAARRPPPPLCDL
jgi:hypothetical protein